MTKEQKDKILKALAEDRNDYARECVDRITAEQGKIMGADYMMQRFFNVLNTEVESRAEESEDIINMKMKIWITTYWTTEIEPVVTPFDNREAAETCARYYERQGYKVCIDECDICHECTDTESEDVE